MTGERMTAVNSGVREREQTYEQPASGSLNPESRILNPVQRILILDFGSQVTQLIARRVREAGVYSEIHPHDVSDAFIHDFAPRGIILSGSHASSFAGEAPR